MYLGNWTQEERAAWAYDLAAIAFQVSEPHHGNQT